MKQPLANSTSAPLELLFATTNQGKFAEAQALLGNWVSLKSLADYPQLLVKDVAETGETLQENAAIKAQVYGDEAQIITVAEDSGLFVNALEGRPGIHSARYGASTPERNQKLLDELKGIADRSAHFQSVLCLYQPDTGEQNFFVGRVNGVIAQQVADLNLAGFGYDFVFIPSGYELTFAELGMNIKNKLSHRRQAFLTLQKHLSSAGTS